MKVTIIKKQVKEGFSEKTQRDYKIQSLFVKFDDSKVYNQIVKYLEGKGATIDQIERFCKGKVYKEKLDYAFYLNCSNFTFERVESCGILDANIIFTLNEQGYINAKIMTKQNEEGKMIEQVLSYEAPKEFQASESVGGWATEAPAPEPVAFQKSAEDEIIERAKAAYYADPFETAKPIDPPKTMEEMMKEETANQEPEDLPF